MKETHLSSIYMIIRNKEGKILLQRRQGTNLWCGFLALPAGHVDDGENVYDALVREAREELGIKISVENVVDTFVVNRRNKSLDPYFDVYFELNGYEGIINIMEPNKCSALVWADPNNLPDDMIEFERIAIEANAKGIKFSSIDVDNEETLSLKKTYKND